MTDGIVMLVLFLLRLVEFVVGAIFCSCFYFVLYYCSCCLLMAALRSV